MPGIEFDSGRLEFDPSTGKYSIYSGEVEVFRSATARLVTGVKVKKKKDLWVFSGRGEWEVTESGQHGLSASKRQDWGRMLFRARPVGTALILEVGMALEGEDEPLSIEAMAPLFVPPGGIWPGRESLKNWRVYVNGWQCWSPSGTVRAKRPGDYLFPLFLPRFLKPMLANTATPVSSERGRFESEWFGALGDIERGDSVVLGFTGVTRALSQVSFRLGRKTEESGLEAAACFEGKVAERGTEVWSEPLAVIPGDLSTSNLETYAELAGSQQGARAAQETPPGWCSWYQYFRDVTKEKVISNLDLLSGKYSDLGIELFQVDDGYQAEVGDWLKTNDSFPGGTKAVADEIMARVKMPGVWVAPFTATRKSSVYREKKAWLTKSGRGRPVLAGISPDWGSQFYGLDLTDPEVLERTREVFSTLAAQGFSFFKLDFLATGLLEGARHDESSTRAQAARRALEVIREAVGEESVVIAAGGPIMLGVGILDAQRIGPDVGPAWRPLHQRLIRDRATPGLHNCMVNMFTRAFMNGRLFEADPGCLMLRASDTSLTPAETRTLASGIAVFGGAFLVSDDLGLWGPEQEQVAASMLPLKKARPRCPDLWLNEVPRLLVSELRDLSGGYHLAWVVNWADVEREVKVSLEELGIAPGRYHGFEFWTERYLGETDTAFSLGKLPPHGSAVLRITPASDEPRLVGSNLNLSQGAVELWSFVPRAGRLNLSFSTPVKRRAVVVLSLPGAGNVHARGAGEPLGVVSISRLTTTAYRLEFELDRSQRLELEWSRRWREGEEGEE